jgi:hypothetical protein
LNTLLLLAVLVDHLEQTKPSAVVVAVQVDIEPQRVLASELHSR